jgi:hypothetical protein
MLIVSVRLHINPGDRGEDLKQRRCSDASPARKGNAPSQFRFCRPTLNASADTASV